jgi:F-type H+-transporting ATPase subunit alpha
VEEQVMILYAATHGFMDDVAVARVRAFEQQFLEYMRKSKPDILAGIRNLGTLSEPEVLSEAINSFKKVFLGVEAQSEKVQGSTKAST